ncbi:MAG: hypothetical protein J5965_00575 [Aeriscardovia sp.]|nr:hypothetical protein [Aeriscardovia sp.]MBO6253634.1 hypothetical protein [Bacteroidaceae bacterium]MBP3715358.1 hypothetical protein [Phocaeicola sp.]
MTTAQEDRIINQAREILERREDERAKLFAVEHEIKINVQRLAMYASYYQGARMIGVKVLEGIQNRKPKGDDWVYLEAEWRLYTESVRNMQLYMDGYEIRYRNHQRDKKGKLISVEAYFVQRREVVTEIK